MGSWRNDHNLIQATAISQLCSGNTQDIQSHAGNVMSSRCIPRQHMATWKHRNKQRLASLLYKGSFKLFRWTYLSQSTGKQFDSEWFGCVCQHNASSPSIILLRKHEKGANAKRPCLACEWLYIYTVYIFIFLTIPVRDLNYPFSTSSQCDSWTLITWILWIRIFSYNNILNWHSMKRHKYPILF